MYPCFDVAGISIEKLLREWRWLVTGDFTLLAINPFGDLFLEDAAGPVHRLDVTSGTISRIANSAQELREAIKDTAKEREWFLLDDAEKAKKKGYSPEKGQCIGAKIPWVLKESATISDNLCVIDLYQYASFMGEIHGQMKDVPDGGKVRLKIQPAPDHAG